MNFAGRAWRAAVLVGVLLFSSACTQNILYPTPTVTSLSPNTSAAGGATFTLTVNGQNFVFGAQVYWNNSPITTIFVNESTVQATVGPTYFNTPATIPVQVLNPPPGGGLSNTVNFTVTPVTSPIPTISSIQPAAALAGGSGLNVTVTGTNFTTTSAVTWNGVNLSTNFVNSTELQGTVPAANLATPGVVQLAVLNANPGGGLSNVVDFDVNNPSPVLRSISPTTAMADSAGFTVTVDGSGFTCAQYTTSTTTVNGVPTSTTTCTTPASAVNWNGTALSTNYISSTQLVANVSSAQLSEAGTAYVTVNNPTPGGGISGPGYLQVIPGANGEGLPMLVDVSSQGAQADDGIGNLGQSGPAIGGGGRFIAFSSISQNLVTNLANAVANVFVRDTCLGITSGCTPETVLASTGNNGEPPNADCLQPSISSDGRYVVYTSSATNLVSNVTSGNTKQIYLTDTCLGASSGCGPSTTLISIGTDGATPGNGSSSQPYISADGQYVAFASTATNLVSQATTGAPEIYLRSTCLNASTSCTPATTLVSLAPDGVTPADGTSATPVVASGGLYVAFQSTATNLVSVPSSATPQIYWRQTCIGSASSCTPTTSLVSIASDGTSPGNDSSLNPVISSDGRYVVFASKATDLIGSGFVSGTPQQIYERDMCAGASGCTPATSLISVAADGSSPANAVAEYPAADQSGRYILFASQASNLTANPANGFEQIFARDTCLGATGCTPATALISVAADGTTLGNGDSLYPFITTQAHFAAYLSFASNIVSDDIEPGYEDIFLAVTPF